MVVSAPGHRESSFHNKNLTSIEYANFSVIYLNLLMLDILFMQWRSLTGFFEVIGRADVRRYVVKSVDK